ncbi:MAG: insulinase family protein [Myxococcales bacterium]|nr:insulinase family protein [Myxococcales bacterium]
MKVAVVILGLALAVAFGAPLAAQDLQPPAGAAATVHRAVLPSGAVLLVERVPGAETVALQAVFPGGTRAEEPESCGIHQLIARLFGRKTSRHGVGEIGRLLAEMRGRLEGFAGRNSFGLFAEFPKDRAREGLALAADSLAAEFPEREVLRARDELLSAIREHEEDPAAAALDAFLDTLYRAHPYRLPLLGRMSAVADLRAPRLREFYARAARPDRLVVAVVGDVEPASVVETLRSRLAAPAQKTKSAPPPAVPLEPLPDQPRARAVVRAIAKTYLVVGFAGLTVQDADRHALQLAGALLEGPAGISPRLRAAGVSASSLNVAHMNGIEPGFFAVVAAVEPSQVARAKDAILEALRALAGSLAPAEELERVRREALEAATLARTRPAARAAELAYAELFGLALGAGGADLEDLSRVSAGDVQRVSRRVFVERAPVVVTVGPGARPAPAAAEEKK